MGEPGIAWPIGQTFLVGEVEHRRDPAVTFRLVINKAGRPDVDAFEAVMMREGRTKGFFVSFGYTSDAKAEIGAFFRRTGKAIIPLHREGDPRRRSP